MSSQFSVQTSLSNLNVSKQNAGISHRDIHPVDTQVDSPSLESGKSLPSANNSTSNNATVGAKTVGATIAEAVRSIEEKIQNSRREIKFEVSEELGTPIVSVLDQDTKEVIRQFPPEEIVALAERVAELGDDSGKLFRSVA